MKCFSNEIKLSRSKTVSQKTLHREKQILMCCSKMKDSVSQEHVTKQLLLLTKQITCLKP